jgi:hypothetical protein
VSVLATPSVELSLAVAVWLSPEVDEVRVKVACATIGRVLKASTRAHPYCIVFFMFFLLRCEFCC